MPKHGWKDGMRIASGLNADDCAAELMAIRRRDGHVDAEAVVRKAKNPKSAMHAAFEWDDAVAAGKHRLEQARYLLRSIVVYRDDAKTADPVFVSVERPEDPTGARHVYVVASEAMAEETHRELILAEALRDLKAWRVRYAKLQELARIHAAIDEAIQEELAVK